MKESRKITRLETLHPKIRKRFPLIDHDSQGNKRIYLNTGAGSLMVDSAIEAMSDASQWMNPMPGAVCPGEIATAEFHERVRGIAADFLHASGPEEISFHISTTAALFNLAFAMRSIISRDHNLIVTDLDHMANVSPWENVWGDRTGCEIRRARIDDQGRLDVDHLLSLVDRRTRVVALTMASNGVGTIVPLREIIASLREKNRGVMVCVDAVHHALHGSIDVQEIDCDFLAFSGYKIFGPMLGILWGKKTLLERLQPYRVETNKNEPPFKFEMGMLSNGTLGSLDAALSYLLWIADEILGSEASPSDRILKFKAAFDIIGEYERELSRKILEGLDRFPKESFRLYGISEPQRAEERDPTFAFEVSGESAQETKKRLWENHSIQIADGNHYSAVVYRHLGKPALCRASFAHYDTMETAETFIEGLRSLLSHD